MKIDRIEVINLRFEYPQGKNFRGAGGFCSGRVTSLVEVHTDTGHVGIGSAYSHPALVHLIVTEQLAPLLYGEDATAVETLWDRMYAVTRWYGRKGAASSALGAVDIALWDLRGQAQSKPIWTLLGGRNARCPAYGSALTWKDQPAELAAEAASLLARGFRRVKMRIGQSEQYDTEALRAVRRTIGPDNDLLVDASMRYDLKLAQRMGKVLEQCHAFWFEEPFLPEDLDAYVALRGGVGIPLAAGENEFGAQGFRELIRAKAVDIVQPDASRCGGISEVCRVANMAAQAGLGVAPHTWSDAVAVTANAHVVAAVPNGITVEIDQTGNPFIEELLTEPLRIEDGKLELSRAPGLGIALNRSLVERYRMKDPLVVPDGQYSDMVFGKAYFQAPQPYQKRR